MINLPKIVNGYTLTDFLGHGAFASAFKAEKENQVYCIRQLKLGQTNGCDDPWKTWELFEREAEVLSRLDHPRIPKVSDSFTSEEGSNGSAEIYAYMTQTLIPGKNLKDLVSSQGVFTESQVIDIGLQLCEILKYIHSKNVIHRDIKPSNIHLDKDGKIYLLDFGALQDKIAKTSEGSTTFGTLGFAPLEVFVGTAVNQSDLYMVGSTFLNLLSGIHPKDMQESNWAGIPQLNYSRRYAFKNPSLELVVNQLIQPIIKDRIPTAEKLSDYLQKIKEGKALEPNRKKKIGRMNRLIAKIIPSGAVAQLTQTRGAEIEQFKNQILIGNNYERNFNLNSIPEDARNNLIYLPQPEESERINGSLFVSKYRLGYDQGLDNKLVESAESLKLLLAGTAEEQTSKKGYIGNITWFDALKLNLTLGGFTLNLKQFEDLIKWLNSGNDLYNGAGNKIPESERKNIYNELTGQRAPWRAEWLDADFKTKGSDLIINYNHKLINGILVPDSKENLVWPIKKDCYVDLSFNAQGMPTAKSATQNYVQGQNVYHWVPPPGNYSVARFWADSGGAGLYCFGTPGYSYAELGVRHAFFHRK